MSKKLKIWIGIIVLSLSIFLGFDSEEKLRFEPCDETIDFEIHCIYVDVNYTWYPFVFKTKSYMGVNPKGQELPPVKVPKFKDNLPKKSQEKKLYLCSSNNP